MSVDRNASFQREPNLFCGVVEKLRLTSVAPPERLTSRKFASCLPDPPRQVPTHRFTHEGSRVSLPIWVARPRSAPVPEPSARSTCTITPRW